MPPGRAALALAVPVALLALAACEDSCGDDGVTPFCESAGSGGIPDSAAVWLATQTAPAPGAAAEDLDPDGHLLTVGGRSRTLGPNDRWRLNFSGGAHQAALSGVRENCSVVSPGNPASFNVNTRLANPDVVFALVCARWVGTLNVSVTTHGSAPDPDGYAVVVDGSAFGTMAVNEGRNFDVAPGTHTVELRGLASNCTVQGQNPRTLDVPYGDRGTALFVVDCPAPGTCTLAAPRARWTLDGGVAQDVTGGGLSGTVVGAVATADRNGTPATALAFDGTAAVELGDVLNSLSPPFTLTAWVRQPAEARTGFRAIFATDETAGRYFGAWLQVEGTGRLEISYGDGGVPGPAARRTTLSDDPIPADRWVHLAAVVRGPEDLRLLVDGLAVAATPSGTGGPLAHSEGPARVGNLAVVPDNGGWIGDLDDVRVYACALEAEQVATLAGS